MKKVLTLFLAVILYSINLWGQTSIVTIGKAVTQCNDFTFAKNMLIGDGLIFNESKSSPSKAIFYISTSNAFEKFVVEVYKMNNSSEVEKCVITFGEKYFKQLPIELRKFEYIYLDAEEYGLSSEPFQELWECGKNAMGLNRNDKGFYIATFYRYEQEVQFEHLSNLSSKRESKKNAITQSMAYKLSEACQRATGGYLPSIFYRSNSKLFTFSEIKNGKGEEILSDLYNYPEYTENFVYSIYQHWGDVGFKELNFTKDEITIVKNICKQRKAREEKEKYNAKKIAEEDLLRKVEKDELIDKVSRNAIFNIDYTSLAKDLIEWRYNEFLSNDSPTWDDELLNFGIQVKIKKNKSIEVLEMENGNIPQNKHLSESLLKHINVDSTAIIKFPILKRVEPVSVINHVSVWSNFRLHILSSSLPIKLKIRKGEDGSISITNESSLCKTFSKENGLITDDVLLFLKKTIASHPSFRTVKKEKFTVVLTDIVEETLGVQSGNTPIETIPLGYIFNFENSKSFKWDGHTVVRDY